MYIIICISDNKTMFFKLCGNYVLLNLCTWSWLSGEQGSMHSSPLLHHTAKRGLSGFIFDGRPTYPWRRGAEFESAVGSVGVLSTRAGGRRGWRYWEEEQPETHSKQYVGGTTVAVHFSPLRSRSRRKWARCRPFVPHSHNVQGHPVDCECKRHNIAAACHKV